MCSNCENSKCVKFRNVRNSKPGKNNSFLSHGLLLYKKECGLWNRDENSARNIYKIAKNTIDKKGQSNYLSRSKVISDATSAYGLQHPSSIISSQEVTQP